MFDQVLQLFLVVSQGEIVDTALTIDGWTKKTHIRTTYL